MFKINRLVVIIKAENDYYGNDFIFKEKLNIIRGENNRGKSTCIDLIFYALGLEELIGRKNDSVLKSALRELIDTENGKKKVDESKVYLEISNNNKTITLERSIKILNIDSRIVKVYECSYEHIKNNIPQEYYLHDAGAAKNELGFHRFFEEFIHWNLPDVPSYKEKEIKLYLQTIFSGFFIEQKNGWRDFLATIPTYYGIKNVSNRVVEFILNLKVLENTKKREIINERRKKINSEWNRLFLEIKEDLNSINAISDNLDKILINNETDIFSIYIKENGEYTEFNEFKKNIQYKIYTLEKEKLNLIGDISEKLSDELDELKSSLYSYQSYYQDIFSEYNITKKKLNSYINSINEIERNLERNKDIKKLEIYGGEIGSNFHNEICAFCHQPLSSVTLEIKEDIKVMSIDDTIDSLTNQKKMLEISIHLCKKTLLENEHELKLIKESIVNCQKNIRTINKELISDDRLPSEQNILNKIQLKEMLNKCSKFEDKLKTYLENMNRIRKDRKDLDDDIDNLPKEYFSETDEIKLDFLKRKFIHFANLFGYKTEPSDEISISRDKYFPTINGFDMKYDSSASYNIRAIWAYTCALLETSYIYNGNHANVLIFDEPGQHQMDENDINIFFTEVNKLSNNCEVIIATSASKDKIERVTKGKNINYIEIEYKSLKKLGKDNYHF